MKVSYFARNIYETETVTSALCYIKDLICLNNNIVWFWNSLDVQSVDSSVDYVIYFHIRDSFFNNFLHQFWKRKHNSKEIVNMQGLFVLTITIGYLFISTFSSLLFLYAVSWRYKRDYLYASIDILFSILLTRLVYITFALTIQKRPRFEPAPPFPVHYLQLRP